MIIRCWGSRGSIPVSGEQYLKYGGDTTCIEIRNAQNDVIIIDAGSGIRRLGNYLLGEGCSHLSLLFTHAHWDHLMGFPFFKPIYHKATQIELYGCPFAQKSIENMLAEEMEPPHFPVSYDKILATIHSHGYCQRPFHIGDMKISPILISHPNQGIGYKFEEDGKAFVFLTDNELTYRHENSLPRNAYCEFSAGVDLLFHDAEFTREEYSHTRSWGHSVYEDALNLACEAGVKSFGLFHHNQERSDAGIDTLVDHCTSIVRGRGIEMNCFAVATGTELIL